MLNIIWTWYRLGRADRKYIGAPGSCVAFRLRLNGKRLPTKWTNSASKARKPTKKQKQQQKEKEGGINELAIILQNFLNSSFPGRDVWGVGGWVWHNPDPRTKLGEKACKVSREQRSQGNQRMVHYVLSPSPSPNHCYFILPYAISHIHRNQPVSSISSLTMRPHVECLVAPLTRRRPWLCSISATVPLCCSIYWEISIDPSI